MENILRDEATMSIVKELLGGYHDYIAAARDTLMGGRRARGGERRRVLAATGHALASRPGAPWSASRD